MKSKKIIISNDKGIHTRPGNEFILEAKKFKADIILEANNKSVNGKSLFKLLSLNAQKGTEILIKAEGEDEVEAIEKLAEHLANIKDPEHYI